MIQSLLPDSVPTAEQEIEIAKRLPLDEFLQHAVNGIVTLTINVLIAVVVFYIGKFLISRIDHVLNATMARRRADRSIQTFVASLVRITLYFLLIITVIGILGIETSSFIALFASAGVAIGMALSGTLQNFAGGVLILLLKPYKVGDYIEAQGFSGTVKEIQIFNTVLTTGDNKSITIPNGGLSTSSINNYSREDYRRVDIPVSIAYGDSVENARKQILDIVATDARVITEEQTAGRGAVVYVNELGASSVDLIVRVWTLTSDYWGVYFALNEKFYTLLPERGVNFPFPQMDVHIVKD